MDREIAIDGWQADWVARTLPALRYYTIGLSYVLSAYMIAISFVTLLRQRRCRLELQRNPSTRAATLAALDKQLLRTTRTFFGVALVFLVHAMAIWIVDAVIGIIYVASDATENPYDLDGAFLVAFALFLLTFVVYLVAAFVLFPLLQMIGVATILARVRRQRAARGGQDPTQTTLSAYVPEARIVSTHMAQLWLMLAFFVVAWWPVEAHATWRIVAVEAALGSGFAWLDASFAFNFCHRRLAEVEIGSNPGVAQLVRLFGTQIVAVHSKAAITEALPTYQDAAVGEKQALLSSVQ